MPSRVSVLASTASPEPCAPAVGTIQYSDSNTVQQAQHATTNPPGARSRRLALRATSTIAGTASSWKMGTTPAFMPLPAANARPKAAAHLAKRCSSSTRQEEQGHPRQRGEGKQDGQGGTGCDRVGTRDHTASPRRAASTSSAGTPGRRRTSAPAPQPASSSRARRNSRAAQPWLSAQPFDDPDGRAHGRQPDVEARHPHARVVLPRPEVVQERPTGAQVDLGLRVGHQAPERRSDDCDREARTARTAVTIPTALTRSRERRRVTPFRTFLRAPRSHRAGKPS